MFKNKIDRYLRRVGYTWMKICWTRYAKGFLVHLPSRYSALGGNLLKSCLFMEQAVYICKRNRKMYYYCLEMRLHEWKTIGLF